MFRCYKCTKMRACNHFKKFQLRALVFLLILYANKIYINQKAGYEKILITISINRDNIYESGQ